MKVRRIIWIALLVLLLLVLVAAITGAWIWPYFHPRVESVDRVVYTQRHGHELTFDVVRPARPNGLGIAVMVSGSWKSGPDGFHAWMAYDGLGYPPLRGLV